MTEISRFQQAIRFAQDETSTGGVEITKEEAARILAGAAGDPLTLGEVRADLNAAGFADIDEALALIDRVSAQDVRDLAKMGYVVGDGGFSNLAEAIKARQDATTGGETTGIMDEATRGSIKRTQAVTQGKVTELGFTDVAAFQKAHNEANPDNQLPIDGTLDTPTLAAITDAHDDSVSTSNILRAESNLQALGIFEGTPDGRVDDRLTAAVKAFQESAHIEPANGVLNSDTRAVLTQKIQDVQAKLVAAGYSVGPKGADGFFGTDTLGGVKDFQASWNQAHPDQQLNADGRLDTATLQAIGAEQLPPPLTNASSDGGEQPDNQAGIGDTSHYNRTRDSADPVSASLEGLQEQEVGFLRGLWDAIVELFTLGQVDTASFNDKAIGDTKDDMAERGQALASHPGIMEIYGRPDGSVDFEQAQRDILGGLRVANPYMEPQAIEERAELMFNAFQDRIQAALTAVDAPPEIPADVPDASVDDGTGA